jgi:hypothetical protein
VLFQWTGETHGSRPAVLLGQTDQQGVELIEERHVFGQSRDEVLLCRIVGGVVGQQAQSRADTPGVCVDDKGWLADRVEQDAVCGLPAHSMQSQYLAAQSVGVFGRQTGQVPCGTLGGPQGQGPEIPRLDPVGTGGPDSLFEVRC